MKVSSMMYYFKMKECWPIINVFEKDLEETIVNSTWQERNGITC
jgi:hypothetical protein